MDDYSDVNDYVLRLLRAKIAAYNAAAQKFIVKVDLGEAYSRGDTYKELKAALEMKEDL